jgi:hypothetical protein
MRLAGSVLRRECRVTAHRLRWAEQSAIEPPAPLSLHTRWSDRVQVRSWVTWTSANPNGSGNR